MPPEHLRAFEAFLEKVVPVDMIMHGVAAGGGRASPARGQAAEL
jgi:hypothetical protein